MLFYFQIIELINCQARVPGLPFSQSLKFQRFKRNSEFKIQKGTRADAIFQMHPPTTHPQTTFLSGSNQFLSIVLLLILLRHPSLSRSLDTPVCSDIPDCPNLHTLQSIQTFQTVNMFRHSILSVCTDILDCQYVQTFQTVKKFHSETL